MTQIINSVEVDFGGSFNIPYLLKNKERSLFPCIAQGFLKPKHSSNKFTQWRTAVMRKEKKKNRIKYVVNTLENPLKTRLSYNVYKMAVTNEIRLLPKMLSQL